MCVCLCVCESHLCSSLTFRCSPIRKGIILWLFRATLLGLIGCLSKNSGHHNDELDNMKFFVISNYFGKVFVCQKLAKYFQ